MIPAFIIQFVLQFDVFSLSQFKLRFLVFQVAAQNCRRRKLDLITNLSDEIVRAREYKQQLLAEREHLYRLRNEWSNKLLQLEESVLRGMDRDPTHWELGVSATSAAAG